MPEQPWLLANVGKPRVTIPNPLMLLLTLLVLLLVLSYIFRLLLWVRSTWLRLCYSVNGITQLL